MKKWKVQLIEYGGMFGVLVLLLAFFGMTTDHFLTLTNFQTISAQIPAAIIVAVGMTFILLIGEIDLSVGSVLALCSAVFSVCLLQFEWPLVLAMGACIATGMLAGLVNGTITAKWALPSFIVTLAMLEVARGLTFMVTDSRTQYVGRLIDPIRDAKVMGMPMTFIVALGVAALAQILLSRTLLGRYTLVVGHSEQVAQYSGINPKRIKLIVFTICGTLVGLAAIIHTARLSSSDPNTGIGFELEAIAAVVIGGTSLSGGRGSIIRSLFGVLVLALLGSGLVQVGAAEHTKRIVTGLVIIGAVILDRYRQA